MILVADLATLDARVALEEGIGSIAAHGNDARASLDVDLHWTRSMANTAERLLCLDGVAHVLNAHVRTLAELGDSTGFKILTTLRCKQGNSVEIVSFDSSVSRAMWEAVERFHGLTYTAPQVRVEGDAAGLKGFWMNYFATRIAPVGAVGPDIVSSTFFYYAPSRVHRAIPDAWKFSSPEAVLAARYRGMQQALAELYSESDADAIAEAAALVRSAVEACDPIGRLLYAGWASVPWPQDPPLALWHGCTLLREYRSGNHLIAICSEGLSGIESLVSHVAVGGAPTDWIRDEAGWTAADEAAATTALREKGWLDATGSATEACHAGRARIEALTDQLDFPVWDQLGESNSARLFELLAELARVLPPDDQLDWQQIYDEG